MFEDILKKIRGDIEEDATDAGTHIAVGLAGTVNMPLDLALELVFRQQSQIMSAIQGQTLRIEVVEEVATAQAEATAHLHNDVVTLQQNLESATTHPAARVEAGQKPDKEETKKKLTN